MAKKTITFVTEIDNKDSIKSISESKKGIESLGESVNELNGDLEETGKIGKVMGAGLQKAGKAGKSGLADISKGFKGVGLAIKAAGIGLVIAAFVALKKVLEEQQPVLDFIDTAFTAIGLAITTIGDVMGPVIDTISEATDGFDALGKVMGGLMTLVLTPFKVVFFAIKGAIVGLQLAWEQSFFGNNDPERIKELKAELDDVGDSFIEIKDDVIEAGTAIVDNITEAVGEIVTLVEASVDAISKIDSQAIIDQAKRTTELKKQAQIAEAINKGRLEQFDRLAERQRQIRDDETKSIEDRKTANSELGNILDEQEKIMLRNANISIQAARAELNANNTTENRVKLIEAQNEKLAVLATVEGFRSEQIINAIGIEKEFDEFKKTATDAEIVRAKELRDFNAEQIDDDELRIQQQKNNLETEAEIEEVRLQSVIDNANAGTQAKVDAEQALFDSEQNFRIKRQEIALEEEEIALEKSELELEEKLLAAENEELEFEERRLLLAERDILIAEDVNLTENQKTKALKENSDARKKIDEAEANAKKATLAKTANVLSSFSELAGKETAAGKALAIGAATINTYRGVSDALAATTVTPFETALKFVNAAAIGVAGISNVKKIVSVKIPKSSSGGGGLLGSLKPPTPPPIPPPPLPTLSPVDDLEGAENEPIGGGAGITQQGIIKAVVLESDITNTQNTISNFESFSEIG